MGRTALVAVVALFLVGCGGGGGGGNVSEQATAPPPTQNTPPTIDGTPATNAKAGVAWSFTPTASDPDGDPLTYEVFGKPDWAAFDTRTGRLAGTPGDADVGQSGEIEIAVSDGKAQASLTPFHIQVAARDGAPPVGNGSATITWTPPTTNTDGSALTNLAGYQIHYGTSVSNLDLLVTVASPGVTSRVIDGLTTGTWYFTVSAYTSGGAHSAFSNVASKTLQ